MTEWLPWNIVWTHGTCSTDDLIRLIEYKDMMYKRDNQEGFVNLYLRPGQLEAIKLRGYFFLDYGNRICIAKSYGAIERRQRWNMRVFDSRRDLPQKQRVHHEQQ